MFRKMQDPWALTYSAKKTKDGKNSGIKVISSPESFLSFLRFPEVGGMWLEEVIGLQHQPRDKPINVKNEHDTSRLMEAYNMLNIPNESLQDYVQHIGSLPNNFY